MSWNGNVLPDVKSDDQITFVMKWRATGSGHPADMIRLTSAVTAVEAYTLSEELLDVKLSFAGQEHEPDFALYQNQPNPWNDQTTIGFDLPEAGQAVLTLFDVTGREVMKIEGQYTAGYHEISLSSKQIPNTGVMYYRLDSGGYSASKKMVMIK
jgi:hypothetical protein